MFKKRYTKWVALGHFTYGRYDYVTFIRKNLKNGSVRFKTKRVNGWFLVHNCTNTFMPKTLIDTKKVWDEINGK